jgi:hypothetical protein
MLLAGWLAGGSGAHMMVVGQGHAGCQLAAEWQLGAMRDNAAFKLHTVAGGTRPKLWLCNYSVLPPARVHRY